MSVKKTDKKEAKVMTKHILVISLTSLLTITCGCGRATKDKNWEITREDYQNILELDGKVEDHKTNYTYTVDNEFGYFIDNVNKENVILFDIDKLDKDKDQKYYTYDDYKGAEIEYQNIAPIENGRGFVIDFDGEKDKHYATIINKTVSIDNVYMISTAKSLNETLYTPEEGKWEKDYIDSKASFDTFQQILNIEQYIGDIVIGAIGNCPTSIVDGAFGIISTITGAFKNNDPTIQDVLDKLADIDSKLDDIIATIDKNQKELINEDIYIENQIDKVLITLYQQNYSNFVTNYLEPLETVERATIQYMAAKIKQYVKANPVTVEIHYRTNEDGTYSVISPIEKDYDAVTSKVQRVEFEGYANAKKFLEDHNDTVCSGFVDELRKDIKIAVESSIKSEKVILDEHITQEDIEHHVYSVILDNFERARHTGEYGTDEYKDAANTLELVIKLLRRISTIATGESILDSMIKRIQCIYNFGNEVKPVIRSLLAHIKLVVDRYTAIAGAGCRYAKISEETLADEYEKAVETIQAYEKVNEQTPDSYCYITQSTIQSFFATAIYKVDYKNLGDHPDFYKEFVAHRVTGFSRQTTEGVVKEPIKLEDYNYVNSVDVRKIASRLGLMIKGGIVEDIDSIIKYLNRNKAITDHDVQVQIEMKKAGWVSDDTYRILTGYDGIQNVTKNDNISFKCTKQGNPGGDYFEVGKRYGYQSCYKNEYWSGEKAVGDFVDATTGQPQSNHVISAYARYSEGHGYWINDERWAFQTNPYGDYFFTIYQE